MNNFKVGDKVIVISGEVRGEQGEVIEIIDNNVLRVHIPSMGKESWFNLLSTELVAASSVNPDQPPRRFRDRNHRRFIQLEKNKLTDTLIEQAKQSYRKRHKLSASQNVPVSKVLRDALKVYTNPNS